MPASRLWRRTCGPTGGASASGSGSTGEALAHGDNYVGQEVHRASRICDAGHGGQIVVSHTTADLVRENPPSSAVLTDLGQHRLRDMVDLQRLFQLGAAGLPTAFPRLRSLDAPHNLPAERSSFIGRENEIARVRGLIARHRLVTLTGIGGSGKTRLALRVGAQELGNFPDGVFFVDLAPIGDDRGLVHHRGQATLAAPHPGGVCPCPAHPGPHQRGPVEQRGHGGPYRRAGARGARGGRPPRRRRVSDAALAVDARRDRERNRHRGAPALAASAGAARLDAITERDARRAGHPSRAALLEELARQPGGRLYRIDVRFAGADPRFALRARTRLDTAERERLEGALARLGARTGGGPWALRVLRLIEARPSTRAAELAEEVGRETRQLKSRVRQLKDLGLTESLDVGYRLSPRGRALLRRRRPHAAVARPPSPSRRAVPRGLVDCAQHPR